jgi:hypothetical protein
MKRDLGKKFAKVYVDGMVRLKVEDLKRYGLGGGMLAAGE